MARTGPVLFEAQGDTFTSPSRVGQVLWEGATAAGDVAELRALTTGELLWAGRAVGVNTYQGINVGPEGIHAPNGFHAALLPAGRMLVYLREK